MSVYIANVTPLPEKIIQGATCRIPCSVKNDTDEKVEVRVFLFEGSTELDFEPDLHWQDIKAGGQHDFKGIFDTLEFVPDRLGTFHLRVELHTKNAGKIDSVNISLNADEKPSWFDSLVASVGVGNKETITAPLLAAFDSIVVDKIVDFFETILDRVFKEEGT